uniref:Ovule protein n=1 Tax=Strongyloides venezuelensis TaxID=75913 RepID=A0A0K0F2J0_STRVS
MLSMRKSVFDHGLYCDIVIKNINSIRWKKFSYRRGTRSVGLVNVYLKPPSSAMEVECWTTDYKNTLKSVRNQY